jgi:ABC-2 type transport system ATP-binding protein
MFALMTIMCIELVAACIALYLLLPRGYLLFLIIAILLSVEFYALNAMRLMLQSVHVLTDDELFIRLGPKLKSRIPLSLVATVEKVSLDSPPKPSGAGTTAVRDGDRFYCLSRTSDVIRIILSKQIMVKASSVDKRNRKGLIREILINVDEPEKFIEKLTLITDLKQQPDLKVSGNNMTPGVIEKKIFAEQATKTGLLEVHGSPSLELKNLARYYGDYPAVQDLSLQVFPGEIFGFLGANGAGKTTAIKMITGLLRPTTGTVLALGDDLWKSGTAVRRRIGYVPDIPLVYERLTAREHLIMAGCLYNMPQERIKKRAEELLSILDLQDWADQMIVSYSMGMQRKVSLALALLVDPEIIIFDELTNAFDAPTLAEIKEILMSLRNEGKTVFLSTHMMDVAEKLCTRVGIIHKGQLVALGKVDELSRAAGVTGGLEPLFLKLTGIQAKTRG